MALVKGLYGGYDPFPNLQKYSGPPDNLGKTPIRSTKSSVGASSTQSGGGGGNGGSPNDSPAGASSGVGPLGEGGRSNDSDSASNASGTVGDVADGIDSIGGFSTIGTVAGLATGVPGLGVVGSIADVAMDAHDMSKEHQGFFTPTVKQITRALMHDMSFGLFGDPLPDPSDMGIDADGRKGISDRDAQNGVTSKSPFGPAQQEADNPGSNGGSGGDTGPGDDSASPGGGVSDRDGQSAAAAPGTGDSDAADNDGGSGGGGSGGGGTKVICTAMNRCYGFGQFRNAIWMRYDSERGTPEALELGYHKLFYPLARRMKKGTMLSAILGRLARVRTDALRREMRGKPLGLEHVIYRCLTRPPCYAAGCLIQVGVLKRAKIDGYP